MKKESIIIGAIFLAVLGVAFKAAATFCSMNYDGSFGHFVSAIAISSVFVFSVLWVVSHMCGKTVRKFWISMVPPQE